MVLIQSIIRQWLENNNHNSSYSFYKTKPFVSCDHPEFKAIKVISTKLGTNIRHYHRMCRKQERKYILLKRNFASSYFFHRANAKQNFFTRLKFIREAIKHIVINSFMFRYFLCEKTVFGFRPSWQMLALQEKAKFRRIFYSILVYPITLEGRRGTTDEFATTPFVLDLFSAALVKLAKSIPVHSLILTSQLFFCLPLFPFIVPCKIVFAKPEDLETWPNHLSFRFLTRVRSSSYSPMAAWIFLQTSSLVTWSLYEMFNSLR